MTLLPIQPFYSLTRFHFSILRHILNALPSLCAFFTVTQKSKAIKRYACCQIRLKKAKKKEIKMVNLINFISIVCSLLQKIVFFLRAEQHSHLQSVVQEGGVGYKFVLNFPRCKMCLEKLFWQSTFANSAFYLRWFEARFLSNRLILLFLLSANSLLS